MIALYNMVWINLEGILCMNKNIPLPKRSVLLVKNGVKSMLEGYLPGVKKKAFIKWEFVSEGTIE